MTDRIVTEDEATPDGAPPQPDLPKLAADPLVNAEIERVTGGPSDEAPSSEVICVETYKARRTGGCDMVFGSTGETGGDVLNGIGTRLFADLPAAAAHPDLAMGWAGSLGGGAGGLCAFAG
ncbi:MAG: hypothetical protein AAF366_10030 [Pseudomonadota bacterium]